MHNFTTKQTSPLLLSYNVEARSSSHRWTEPKIEASGGPNPLHSGQKSGRKGQPFYRVVDTIWYFEENQLLFWPLAADGEENTEKGIWFSPKNIFPFFAYCYLIYSMHPFLGVLSIKETDWFRSYQLFTMLVSWDNSACYVCQLNKKCKGHQKIYNLFRSEVFVNRFETGQHDDLSSLLCFFKREKNQNYTLLAGRILKSNGYFLDSENI